MRKRRYRFSVTQQRQGRQALNRICYIGIEQDARPETYLAALLPGRGGGGREHTSWNVVLGRLLYHYERGGYTWQNGGEIVVWRLAPKALETGLAFASEGALGRNLCFGGMLALSPSIPYVEDACKLQRFHDEGRCVACGLLGHMAGERGRCGVDQMSTEAFPYHVQRLRPRSAGPCATDALASEICNLTNVLKKRALDFDQ